MKRLLLTLALTLAAFAPAAAQQNEERQQLANNVVPVRYALTVQPNAQAMTLHGDVSIDLQVAQPTREIVLHALELTFTRVTFDNRPVTNIRFQESDQTVHLGLPADARAGAHTLAISYDGRINTAQQGLFAADYEASGHTERMLSTMFEPSDARRFLPCFDEPLFKAIFDVTVIAPANRVVISNMPQASSQPMAGGLQRVHFQPSPKMSTYLLYVAIGDFERVTTHAGNVEINVWAKRGAAERGRFALQAAADVLPYYNDYFGTPYPLPKLDLIAVPGNSGGVAAMENWGAILYYEEYILVDPNTTTEAQRQFAYTTVAHEIAHQWFGDLVTMAWWDDLWLNEGFASWMENKASDHFHPEWALWTQQQGAREGAMTLDARPTTHPIVATINTADQAGQAFDSITYRKGNQVIRMFEQFVTEDGFRAGVRAYMHAHAYGNATTADLWDAIEQASGRPLRSVANDFTRQPGVPLINVTAGPCQNNQRTLTLAQSEFVSTPVTRATPRWHIPVSAATLDSNNAVSTVTDDSGAGTLSLASCDPFVINPSQIGYFRTMYPRPEFERLAANFGRLSPSDQLGLLYDTRAFGRYGRTSAADVLTLANRTPVDADPLVWNFIAGEIANINGLYAEDPRADRFRTYARSVLNPVFARVGWSRVAGESDNTSLLRATLIGVMSGLHDDAFEAEALRRYHAGNIDGSVRAAVLGVVGAAATPQVYDELLARARAADDTLEKQINYEALGGVRDEALARRTLDLAISPEIHGAEGPRLIFFVSGNHTELAADFVRQHQSDIDARLDVNTARNAYPGILSGSNDPAMQQRLRAYIDAMPEGTRRLAEVSYAAMSERMATRPRRLDEISAWLAVQRTPRR